MVDGENAANLHVMRGRKIYERHLDLLLAEELTCNPTFARFVCEIALGGSALPAGDPNEVEVVVSNFDEVGADIGAAGEDDLLVKARWASGGAVRVLVEDKLDAVLQPDQMNRYAARAIKHSEVDGVDAAAALLVAPAGYIEGRRSEFPAVKTVSIEQIADWFEKAAASAPTDVKARLLWRSRHILTFDEGKSVPAPELPGMIEARDRIVGHLAQLGSTAQPGAGMRTAGSGWLSFAWPKALTYKVVHGTVDLYLAELWPEDPARVEHAHTAGLAPEGFSAVRDGSGNPVFRRTVRAAGVTPRIRPIDLVDANELARGANACDVAARWAASL